VTEQRVEVRTVTQHVKTTTVTIPAAKPAAGGGSPSGRSYSFSGNGEKVIGTLELAHDSVIRWKNTMGRLFAVSSDENSQTFVSSEGGSGDSVIPAGSYRQVRVYGDNWSFTIRPQ